MACAARQGVRVLDRVVSVGEPIGHLDAEDVPRKEAERDAPRALLVEEIDGVDNLTRRDDDIDDLEVLRRSPVVVRRGGFGRWRASVE